MPDTKWVKSIKSVELPIAPHALIWSKDHLWAVSALSPSIARYNEASPTKSPPVEEIAHNLKNPGGITLAGKAILVSETNKKIIYKIDPVTKKQQVYMDLQKLKKSDATPILKARGTKVPAIAYNQGHLWVTCQAGFSSSIFCFDGRTKKLLKKFWARGSEPLGISFEPDGKRGWVLDGSNRELSQFNLQGKWTKKVVSVPLMKPSGLTIDKKRNFWVTDMQTKKIHQLSQDRVV